MAKLYFRYGTMGSAKTLNLLAVAHNYQQQGKKVLLLKPKMDERFGKKTIGSRAGLKKEADLLLEDNSILPANAFEEFDCILVDEAQFLAKHIIDQLRNLSIRSSVPVICYGLRTDFKSNLFEGSKRLMEIADSVEEIKTTCNFCDKKAIFNMKFIDGKPAIDGPQIELGAEEKYLPACHKCYYEKIENRKIESAYNQLEI
ncbi:MAG: thymidine kinase [Bdellovibrionales bacterium]